MDAEIVKRGPDEGDTGSIGVLEGNHMKVCEGRVDRKVDALHSVHELQGAWSVAGVEQGCKPLRTLLRLPFLETSNLLLREKR
jgi:hypothetical protein